MTEFNLPVPDDSPWLNLSPEEIKELRQNKNYIAEQAKQKIRKLKAQQQSQKIVEATMEHTLRPQKGDRERMIASAFRTLIEQCGVLKYDNFNIDGDHGILVVNVRDILGIIEVLEE